MKEINVFILELNYGFEINPMRCEDAQNLIEITERELKRPLKAMEARVILAESGRFPELEEDLRIRALKASADMVIKGEEYIELNEKIDDIDKGKKLHNRGILLQRAIVLGTNRKREGD